MLAHGATPCLPVHLHTGTTNITATTGTSSLNAAIPKLHRLCIGHTSLWAFSHLQKRVHFPLGWVHSCRSERAIEQPHTDRIVRFLGEWCLNYVTDFVLIKLEHFDHVSCSLTRSIAVQWSVEWTCIEPQNTMCVCSVCVTMIWAANHLDAV